jgi:hypothetical protein
MLIPDETIEDRTSAAAAPPESPATEPDLDSEPKKRNSGRTGPTSRYGRSNSSQNARKHGACARTMILTMESEEGWQILPSRLTDEYQPGEESLAADFVLRTAQAEWFRRCGRRELDRIRSPV